MWTEEQRDKWRYFARHYVSFYHLFQNRMFYRLLVNSLKIKINRTAVLHFVLCGCERGSAEFGGDPRLFENREVRKMFGSERQETAENCTRT
jgi:hypothetical protein